FGSYAPLFTERHKTPWGAAINYDGPDSRNVREFMIHNALYWLEEFHFDGLRLDAVHAIIDDSPRHLLTELSERVRGELATDRHIHLVLENDANQARWLEPTPAGQARWYNAQWADDLHHGLHVAATGEGSGYYRDYQGDMAKLGRALAEGFAFQGEPSAFKGGEARGEPSAHLPPTAFVSFLQNHDQIGNRAMGDRIAALAPPEAVRAVAALYLLSPAIPMLFMGEEWGTTQPFPFFCDFGPELAEAVRRGRREEFAGFPEFSDPASRERIPDATAAATMDLARLPWAELTGEPHRQVLAWYQGVLAVRRDRILPLLARIGGGCGSYELIGPRAIRVAWRVDGERSLMVLANLSHEFLPAAELPVGDVLWREGPGAPKDGGLGPWDVVWVLAEANPTDLLAERMGIEPSFGSAAGGTVRTSAATKQALLGAMGLAAEDETQAKASLAVLRAADRSRALPPVLVVRNDRLPSVVPLTLPAGTGSVAWTITEEGGATHEGTVPFDSLALVHRLEDGQAPAFEVRSYPVPGPLPPGYHTLQVQAGDEVAGMPLIVVPPRCFLPEPIERGERIWGIAAQLYTAHSSPDWGMGDFGTLQTVTALAGSRGADVIGLNPLHALFLERPQHASPYSPASRLHLNPLYIDVTAVPELMRCQPALDRIASSAFKERLAEVRADPLIDHVAVASLKMPLLELLHAHFHQEGDPERHAALAAFQREQGEPLARFCLFQALCGHFMSQDPPLADWHAWPDEWRRPDSPAVQAFQEQHRDRIEFLIWLQWIADTQLAAAAATARERGMAVGLYRDLAVGADGAGAETWANPGVVVNGARVGAPPDIFNPAGQDWGLPPFSPDALRAEAYRSFIDLIRANMRHAGGLRIDHVMALQHLYWIPAGYAPADGAYVAYALDDLLGILALESERHRCLVVGEDLGTVPAGFRERMAEAGVLSYRVLFFEWAPDGSFLAPEAYPERALATIGSHDLATLRGWWEGHDLLLKHRLGLFPDPDEVEAQRARRAVERGHLVQALRGAGFSLPTSFDSGSAWNDALDIAAHAFLARS
ncbi:MAG: 4-alpha-glucanotransferase, partial [Geminicoccaceae bacterium]